MAFEEDVLDVSLLADGDLSTYQYHFVKLTAAGTVGIVSHATNDYPLGVLQNKPSAAGEVARVRVMGVSRVMTGVGGLAFSNKVGSDASGHGIAKATDTYKFLGESTDSTAAGVLGTVILHPLHTISA